MYRPHTNQRRRATTAAALTALFALAVGACGSDDTTGSDSSSPLQASADTTALATPATEPPAPVTQPPVIESTPPTEPTDTGETEPATGDEAVEIAEAALLQPGDIGDGWQDLGSQFAWPMTAELAASVPSCAPFVDVVFEGNTGVWAHTTLGRNTDIAFTSVTVFPTEAEAAAMVAATATPEFDQCWADFNEVGIVAWESASTRPAMNQWSHPTSNWAATHRRCRPSTEPSCSDPPAFPTHASAPSFSRAEPSSPFTQRRPSSAPRPAAT